MKRVILGILMLGGVAVAAAPAHANFNLNLECGKSYAFELHGTEPELTADQPLHYIAGVGQLTFGPQTPSGVGNGCAVTRGELIYNDNDLGTFSAGPATCYTAQSLLGGGVPCFDGGNHITGNLVSFSDGGVTLSIVATMGWVTGAPGTATLPLSFHMQGNAGDSWVLGNSVPDSGPAPTSPPPGSPVLVIQMQQQASPSVVSLPVTGPLPPQPLPINCTGCGGPLNLGTTGGGGNGYGVAPYLGLSVSLFQGFGAPSTDPFSQPEQGSFGSTVSSLQIFSDGLAGGSASFSSNDNVGNTTGATNTDCDTIVTQTGNFADGASNDAAAIVHPSATCLDAFPAPTDPPGTLGGSAFTLSAVQWGVTDTNEYTATTGLASDALTSGELVPVGLEADATGLYSVPAGGVTPLVFTSITSVNGNTPTFPFVEFFSTTPAGCDVSISMPTVTASAGGHTCTLSLENLSMAPTNPVNVVVEGDSFPFSKYAFESCNCTGTSGTSVTGTLTLSSPDCPAFPNSPYTVTCKN